MISVAIQTDDFSLSEELAHADSQAPNCGAVVSFVGKVRGKEEEKTLSHLFLTHMPIVTETQITQIIEQAAQRWCLPYVRVIHRVGELAVGAQIVLVLTTSTHREDAYQANRFIMDYLKTEVPLWKKACFADGSSHWVDMKKSDVTQHQTWTAHD